MRRPLVLSSTVAVAFAAVACGTQDIQLSKSDPDYAGAVIFKQRCAGCHSLSVVGAEGSAVDVNSREYKDGPNFNQRRVDYEQALYAIRNGGFSSGPMPQNLAVGRQAEEVARFVSKYSGKE
jgi:mono/diheme cytochrome c family protein